jgi:hypothetical protein
MEDVKTIVRWLATKQVYSDADLRDGYYNVNVRKKYRHLTEVITVLILFELTVMRRMSEKVGPTQRTRHKGRSQSNLED